MMDYWIEKDADEFVVMSGDRETFARTSNMRDAALIVQTAEVFEDMVEKFPGLLNGEDDVNGGDLVAFLDANFAGAKTLKAYLAGDGEYKNDEEIYDPVTDTTFTDATSADTAPRPSQGTS